MNRSGWAVRQIVENFSLSVEDLLIICDDFNLPFGTLRFRKKGSDGGHNGLKSIIYHLQTENFDRFRLGIGTDFSDAISFVLDNFSKKERTQLNDLLPISTEALKHWIENGIEKTMNIYNRQYTNDNG
jgi:PTH1 family peptidyl-tRNA hydrolase